METQDADQQLELLKALQKTIDPRELVETFGREAAHAVPFSHYCYTALEGELKVESGARARHTLNYNLKSGEQALGEITISREQRFSDEDTRRVEGLLAFLGFPLHHALLYKEAMARCVHDPLTGLLNRAGFDGTLTRELRLARRHQNPLSLIVVDIDHFKQVNDTFGHAAGDHVLRVLSETMNQCVRNTDQIARYGGEEFTVLLTRTDDKGAAHMAERIRKAVQSVACLWKGKSVEMRVSLGVATLRERESERHFFERADKALYQAKNEGRNRVVVAPA